MRCSHKMALSNEPLLNYFGVVPPLALEKKDKLKRKCKHFERESWWYGRFNPENIASSIRCKEGHPGVLLSECYKCQYYAPVELNPDIAEFFEKTNERYRK